MRTRRLSGNFTILTDCNVRMVPGSVLIWYHFSQPISAIGLNSAAPSAQTFARTPPATSTPRNWCLELQCEAIARSIQHSQVVQLPHPHLSPYSRIGALGSHKACYEVLD